MNQANYPVGPDGRIQVPPIDMPGTAKDQLILNQILELLTQLVNKQNAGQVSPIPMPGEPRTIRLNNQFSSAEQGFQHATQNRQQQMTGFEAHGSEGVLAQVIENLRVTIEQFKNDMFGMLTELRDSIANIGNA